ncbi:MAG: FHA domain-containing protein [Polyangia bacterium]
MGGTNCTTAFSPLLSLDATGELMRRGFALVAARLSGLAVPERPACLVAAVDPLGGGQVSWGWLDDPAPGAPAELGVGRHDSSGLCLTSDEGLSLRQALMIFGLTHDGCRMIRLLDLRSVLGMYDFEGTPHLSVLSDGPLRMRLANSLLFAVPSEELLRGGRIAGYDEIRWPEPRRWVPSSPPERYVSSVSRSTRSTTMVSLRRSRAGRSRRDREQSPRAGRLLFEGPEGAAEIEVDRVSLRTGVMVGRYPRCELSGNNAPMSRYISRVHAVLLAVGQRPRIFDPGSTNGIVVDDRPITSLDLPGDRPSSFELSDDETLTWRPG